MDNIVIKMFLSVFVVGIAAASHSIAVKVLDSWYVSNAKILGKMGPGRQRARVSRVIVSAWLYTAVISGFVLAAINTAVLSLDVPFASVVLSWDYGVTGQTLAVFALATVLASGTSVALFRYRYRDKKLDPCAFRKSVAAGSVPFFAASVLGVGLLFLVAPEPQGIGGDPEMELDIALALAGEEGRASAAEPLVRKWGDRVAGFVERFPAKGGMKTLKQRMKTFGFRGKTAKSVESIISGAARPPAA